VLLSSADGELRLNAQMDRGVFKPGSELVLEQQKLSVGKRAFSAELERLELVASAQAAGGEAKLEVSGGKISLPGSEATPVVIETARALARSSSVDTRADWKLTELELQEARATVPDARWFEGALASSGWHARGGASVVSARGSYRDAVLDANVEAAFDRVRLSSGATELALDGKASLAVVRTSLETRSGAVSGKLDGKRIKLTTGKATFEAGGLELQAEATAAGGAGRGSVRAKLGSLRARADTLRFDTQGELHATLEDWDVDSGSAKTTFRGDLRKLVFSAPELAIRAERVALKSLSRNQQKPSKGSSVPAQVAVEATLSKLSFEQGPAEKLLQGTAEELDVSSRLSASPDGSLDAVLRSNARGVEASYDRLRLQGSPELRANIEGFDSARNLGHVRADLTVRGFTANDPAGDVDCPWSSVDVATLHADAELRGAQGMQVELDGVLERARLAWGDFSSRLGKAHVQSRFDGGALERRGSIEVTLAVDDAHLVSGGGAPKGWEARIPALSFGSTLERQESTLGGRLQLGAKDVEARLGRSQFKAQVGLEVSSAALELDQGHLKGAGTVNVRGLELVLPDRRIDDWWADIKLVSLDVWARETLEVSADFRAKLRDGLPALAVLASQGELPGFVPAIFPLRDLQAQGTLERRCQLTDFRVKDVSGGPFSATGRVQSVPEAVRGAFLVRFAVAEAIAAGVGFDGDDSGVSLFAGGGWLREHYAPLDRNAQQTRDSVCIPPPRECGN
jgi:hypothetical protein